MPEPPRNTPSTPDMRILVVDDEPHVREVLVRMLRLLIPGVRIDEAESTEAALPHVGAVPYGAVVTDIKMLGLPGTELLRAVRESQPTCLRFLMSGHNDFHAAVDGEAMDEAAPHGTINKPFMLAELRAALATGGLQQLRTR